MGTTQPVALVTGSRGGIGSATVRRLERDGFRVHGWARPEVDVSDAASVAAAMAELLEREGRLDALVTTAGVLRTGPLHTMTDDLWREVMSINLDGVFHVNRAALAAMLETGGGAIVNLSSVHAVATVPGTAAYAATKAAVEALTTSIAIEYADAGIRANSIVVGSVDTKMSVEHGRQIAAEGYSVGRAPGAVGRMAAPEEIAAVAAHLLSPDASFVTGARIVADGGLTTRLM